ncbi:MAG TPA: lipid A biosynthesis lauroyl acyltransferase, partial [Pseudomonas sp.]|nr:lipid A biosynthesis lauroyl acyltransferase [Pseudomonas sp.]
SAVFLHAIRLEDGSGFKVVLEAAPDDMYSTDTYTAVSAMSRVLASYVQRWPDQYMWTMKRFKKRPEGEKRWY